MYIRGVQAFQSGRYFSHKFKRNKILLYASESLLYKARGTDLLSPQGRNANPCLRIVFFRYLLVTSPQRK